MSAEHKPDPEFVEWLQSEVNNPFLSHWTVYRMEQAFIAARERYQGKPISNERVLVRHQTCGCIVCICEDDEQCQGCGAKSCGTHPVGEIPNPVYVNRYDPDPIVSKAWLKKLNAWDELLGEVKKQGIPRYMRHQVQAMRNGLRGYRDHGWKYEASKDVAEKGVES